MLQIYTCIVLANDRNNTLKIDRIKNVDLPVLTIQALRRENFPTAQCQSQDQSHRFWRGKVDSATCRGCSPASGPDVRSLWSGDALMPERCLGQFEMLPAQWSDSCVGCVPAMGHRWLFQRQGRTCRLPRKIQSAEWYSCGRGNGRKFQFHGIRVNGRETAIFGWFSPQRSGRWACSSLRPPERRPPRQGSHQSIRRDQKSCLTRGKSRLASCGGAVGVQRVQTWRQAVQTERGSETIWKVRIRRDKGPVLRTHLNALAGLKIVGIDILVVGTRY